MCGIAAYVGGAQAGDRADAGVVVIEGLRRLEYRGYDSAGVAVVSAAQGGMHLRRAAGPLANLEALLASDPVPRASVGLGHTRWATHGAPSDVNAHPHPDCDGRLAVVHNGLIENHAQLREALTAAGHVFASATDSEVIAHLLEDALRDSADLAGAMRAICRRLEGSFAIVAASADEPGVLVGARRNSPLVVGVGDGEAFVASDVAAFVAYTTRALEIGQDQVVEVTSGAVRVTTFDGDRVEPRAYAVDWDLSAAEKGGYDFFMLKEIAEQPGAVAETLLGRLTPSGQLTLDETRLDPAALRDADKIVVVACGSAYHAGLIAKYAVEHWAGIPCEVELASEFRYRDPILGRRTLVVAISQSGETMDTLMAVRHAREQGARVLAICNTNGSAIPRESDAVLYTRAGPEIGVAATKTFLTQVTAVYLLALYLAQERGLRFGDEVAAVVRELAAMPDAVERVLATMGPVRELARSLADARAVLFIGRHVGYPLALEGALKLKELAYLHAEGFGAGELKHGPIALVDDDLPVVVVMPPARGRSVLHDKMLSNIQEVRARGARTIVLAEEGDDGVAAYADALVQLPAVPTLMQPLVAAVPLQVFACELAAARGHNVDRPRNLAKSVTVE